MSRGLGTEPPTVVETSVPDILLGPLILLPEPADLELGVTTSDLGEKGSW